jgi:lysophospholipid acyltransferase (LPLAT)-like uncharacterized protein
MPTGRSRRSSSGKIVVPNQPKWYQRLAAAFIVASEHVMTLSFRYTWGDDSGLFRGHPAAPVIFCLWHNRLALSMALFRKYVRRHQPERCLAALISASKDGAFLAAILERFGVQPVRGSTSRRGPQALLELTSWAARGYDLAITPDGPRGPRYIVQEGAIALAQLTSLPIVPVTCYTKSKICLKSWDSFQLPLPFARCEVLFGKPIMVSREASDEEREAARVQLEKQMVENSKD